MIIPIPVEKIEKKLNLVATYTRKTKPTKKNCPNISLLPHILISPSLRPLAGSFAALLERFDLAPAFDLLLVALLRLDRFDLAPAFLLVALLPLERFDLAPFPDLDVGIHDVGLDMLLA